MRNVLAIAHKELKSYFSSPIAYIVLGFWALLYGYFFVAILQFSCARACRWASFPRARRR
jgi:ABC-2 type transport system permease protein